MLQIFLVVLRYVMYILTFLIGWKWRYPIFMIFSSKNHRNHPRKKTSGPPGAWCRISDIKNRDATSANYLLRGLAHADPWHWIPVFFLQKMGGVSLSLHVFFRLKLWWKHQNRKFCWVRIEGKDCFEMFWNPKYGWNMFILVRVSRCWMRYIWCFVDGFFELQVYDFDLPPTQDASHHHNTFSRESL